MSIWEEVLEHVQKNRVLRGLADEANRYFINKFAMAIPPRPRAFSLWSPTLRDPNGPELDPDRTPNYITTYTSWPGLVDKSFQGRHLPPVDTALYTKTLPIDAAPTFENNDPSRKIASVGQVTALFQRKGAMKLSRSSVLFPFFAQWFTDSVLRFDPNDRRRNNSNHDIDLCQIYGLTEKRCRALRVKTDPKRKGQLHSRFVFNEASKTNEELPLYLYSRDAAGKAIQDAAGNYVVDPIFEGAIPDSEAEAALKYFPPARRDSFYATGLERGNQSIGYVAISTIFLREHNRLAAGIAANNPNWDDERVFQTARCVNIVILMKLIVEDYINHILGIRLFQLDHAFAEREHWYRANWMSLEFDMLYRWHGLPPDTIRIDGKDVHASHFRFANDVLEKVGIAAVIDAVSRQPAGTGQMGNTPDYLWMAEYMVIKMGRDFQVMPYNAYRTRFGLAPYKSFDEFPCDPEVRKKLQDLYVHIDRLELYVGLFAEEPTDGPGKKLLWGDLLNHMVAYDAFTQIFSNPLLSTNVWGPDTFTPWGLGEIERTTSIQDLVDRNVHGPSPLATLGVPEVNHG